MPGLNQCRRRGPHTPHGFCGGLAPEFPSEAVEQVPDSPEQQQLRELCDKVLARHPGAAEDADLMGAFARLMETFEQLGETTGDPGGQYVPPRTYQGVK